MKIPRAQQHSFRVHHIAAPQGSHKQGFGKSVRETNPRTEPYRHAVAEACEDYIEDQDAWVILDGYLAVELTFWMPPAPKSDPHRLYPNTSPDIDKLVRSTFDGITRGKLWVDDARVVKLTTSEEFAASLQETGVDVAVWKLS